LLLFFVLTSFYCHPMRICAVGAPSLVWRGLQETSPLRLRGSPGHSLKPLSKPRPKHAMSLSSSSFFLGSPPYHRPGIRMTLRIPRSFPAFLITAPRYELFLTDSSPTQPSGCFPDNSPFRSFFFALKLCLFDQAVIFFGIFGNLEAMAEAFHIVRYLLFMAFSLPPGGCDIWHRTY